MQPGGLSSWECGTCTPPPTPLPLASTADQYQLSKDPKFTTLDCHAQNGGLGAHKNANCFASAEDLRAYIEVYLRWLPGLCCAEEIVPGMDDLCANFAKWYCCLRSSSLSKTLAHWGRLECTEPRPVWYYVMLMCIDRLMVASEVRWQTTLSSGHMCGSMSATSNAQP